MRNTDELVLASDGGRSFNVGPNQVLVKTEGDATDGAFSMIHWTFPPGAPAPPLHIHHSGSETFFVLEGEVEFSVGDEKVLAGPGTRVHMAPGVRHTLGNPTPSPARALEIFCPAKLLGLVEEVGRIFAEGMPPDVGKLKEAFARHDSEIAGS
jgi:quercetin dioxygenase-like cupin family protein